MSALSSRALHDAALVVACALPLIAADAAAQCYKGVCNELFDDAGGSNFGETLLDLDVRALAVSLRGVSGGDLDVGYLGSTPWGDCVGFATALPDHIFTVEGAARDVRFAVTSQADTVLLIHGPDGWMCNDDADGSNPEVSAIVEAGTYRVWVGGYRRGNAEYVLDVTGVRGGGRPAPGPRPPPPGPAVLDPGASSADWGPVQFDRTVLRDPIVATGVGGGSVDASYLGATDGGHCFGFAGERPDHIVTVTERIEQAELLVSSAGPTSLIVHGPHGWLCAGGEAADEGPALGTTLVPGTYRVWIGSWEPGQQPQYALTFLDRGAPPRADSGWSFVGRLETTDVRFEGATLDDVAAACRSFVGNARSLGMVDDITAEGVRARNTMSWWSPEAMCAIVALNATPDDPRLLLTLAGEIEGVPFALWGDAATARATASRWLPVALADTNIDDVLISGRSHHNTGGWWTAQQAAAMVGWNLLDPAAAWEAIGNIEGVPFALAGPDASDIGTQCRRMWAEVLDGEWIDDIEVNGQSRHNTGGWWQADEGCMIVSSLARRR